MNDLCEKRTWKYIQDRNFHDSTIILDIDGVLMADSEKTISEEIINHVQELKRNNDVQVVTNSFIKERCRYVSEVLQIPWVDSPYKKPSIHILNYMNYDSKKPLIMIGDKILTDGIFAKRIGAEAIMMQRRIRTNDRLVIKFTYLIDDIAYWFFSLWCTR